MSVTPSSARNPIKPLPPPSVDKKGAASSKPPPAATDKKGGSPSAQRSKDTFSPGPQGTQSADSPGAQASSNPSANNSSQTAGPAGRVTLFDNFGSNVDFHGKKVNNVVTKNLANPTPIQEVEVQGLGTPPTNLDESIEGFAANNLHGTSEAIENVLKNPGNTKVINQSQGVTPARFYSNAFDTVTRERKAGSTAEKPGPFEQNYKKELGLADNVDFLGKEGTQKFMDRIDKVFQDSPKVAEAKKRYAEQSQKLEDAGILHVVAVGNENRALKRLDDLGVTHGKDAANSVYVNDKTVTVGATTGEDVIAPFSVPNPEVDVAVDGENVPVGGGLIGEDQVASGTSVAAPQVSAVVSDLFGINPNLTNNQVRGILRDASRDTAIPAELEGAGILDPAKARQLAQKSLTAVTEL